MRILVTGASGLLGKLVVETAARRLHEVSGLKRTELDITDRASVRRAIHEFSPSIVINCAAYTDVDGAEREPERAFQVNAGGAAHVAEAARELGAGIVHVSTDYVFDGQAHRPYREDDVTAPLSRYGRSKLEGELRVASAHPEGHVIVRTAWLYGPGKGFVDWARGRLERGDELRLIEDQTGSPTSAREFAGALVRLIERGHLGLFHYVNPGTTSWLDFGRTLARELGVENTRIRPVQASEVERLARRPSYSVLSVERFERTMGERLPSWLEALRRYLASS
ncbi:MAG TPA: dTDP-4-dehydrorhamnose reductase [Vicinamibacteria bacterium]|nr:dTDP-4-dehydrorhamnose reductase [Vicinamibacteria bacterium]